MGTSAFTESSMGTGETFSPPAPSNKAADLQDFLELFLVLHYQDVGLTAGSHILTRFSGLCGADRHITHKRQVKARSWKNCLHSYIQTTYEPNLSVGVHRALPTATTGARGTGAANMLSCR
ncbi:hypothetical protein EYF80_052978 [Liparis tanakae]|uniref:Uncharacterized protein n=1 Tax=Liparis tanakae TaxID=230148 RepID=A0A4Z2F6T2_9TELE|nr:hypothetical protein EYF80_052978 [Liparis tanakae]